MNRIKPLFYGTVSKGKLCFNNPAELSRYLSQLEGEVQVTIESKKKKRSTAENNYYWGVVVELLSEHFGYTPEEMHSALKFEFLYVHRDSKPDTIRSTTDLSTVEMEDYLSKIRIWASAAYSVFIPEPNEVDWS